MVWGLGFLEHLFEGVSGGEGQVAHGLGFMVCGSGLTSGLVILTRPDRARQS